MRILRFWYHTWKTWLGIIAGSVFLYLACRKVDLYEVSLSLRAANYVYLIPTIILTMGSILMRAYRWGFLLLPIQRISFPHLFYATSIGLMANNLLPARLGELVRAYAIGRTDINRSSAFATIVVERVLDLFTLLCFLAVVLVFFPFPEWMTKGGYLLFLFNAAILGFLVLLKISPGKAEKACVFVLTPVPHKVSEKLTGLLRSFVDGLSVFGHVWVLAVVIVLSVVLWLMVAVAIWSACLAFGFDLPFYAPLIILVFISVGITIPSAPGFVGTFQFFAIKGLSLFNVSGDRALSFAIAFHATQFVPITLIGLLCLWVSNMSLRQAVRVKAEA